jgi:hypothetical protein
MVDDEVSVKIKIKIDVLPKKTTKIKMKHATN